MAVALAELYSEVVGFAAIERKKVSREELRTSRATSPPFSSGSPSPWCFFLLAAVGVLDDETAFEVVKWAGLGLIGLYGFAGARLSGNGA